MGHNGLELDPVMGIKVECWCGFYYYFLVRTHQFGCTGTKGWLHSTKIFICTYQPVISS